MFSQFANHDVLESQLHVHAYTYLLKMFRMTEGKLSSNLPLHVDPNCIVEMPINDSVFIYVCYNFSNFICTVLFLGPKCSLFIYLLIYFKCALTAAFILSKINVLSCPLAFSTDCHRPEPIPSCGILSDSFNRNTRRHKFWNAITQVITSYHW